MIKSSQNCVTRILVVALFYMTLSKNHLGPTRSITTCRDSNRALCLKLALFDKACCVCWLRMQSLYVTQFYLILLKSGYL